MNTKGTKGRITTAALATAAITGLFAGMAHASPPSHVVLRSLDHQGAVAFAGAHAGSIAADAGKHDCKGHNECSGQGGCKSGDNGCKGKNSCKGKGGCATNK